MTPNKKQVLRATSTIRGISMRQIHTFNLYRPYITVQSLLSNGYLKPDPLRDPEDREARFFLTDKGMKWKDRDSNPRPLD